MFCCWGTFSGLLIIKANGRKMQGALLATVAMLFCEYVRLSQSLFRVLKRIADLVIEALRSPKELDEAAEDLWRALVRETMSIASTSSALADARAAVTNSELAILAVALMKMRRGLGRFAGWCKVDRREDPIGESSDTSSIGPLERPSRPAGG